VPFSARIAGGIPACSAYSLVCPSPKKNGALAKTPRDTVVLAGLRNIAHPGKQLNAWTMPILCATAPRACGQAPGL